LSVELKRNKKAQLSLGKTRQTSLAVNICGLPLSGSWSYRAIDWTVSVVGALLLQARRLGIRCQTVFVTQNWVSTRSNVSC